MAELMEAEHKTRWVTISQDELESLQATLEILSDPEWRAEALAGKAEAAAGKTRPLKAILKEVED